MSENKAPERIWIDNQAYSLERAKEHGGGIYYFAGDSHAIEYVRADLLAAAVEDERERCVKIVESFAVDIHMEEADAGDIILAIRTQGDPPAVRSLQIFEPGFGCTCPTECDCQSPNTPIRGISNECPVHNDNPKPSPTCPVHGEVAGDPPKSEVEAEKDFDERENGCLCQRCGTRYKVDINVPDEIWERIRGTENLLCGPCVVGSIELLGRFDYFNLSR